MASSSEAFARFEMWKNLSTPLRVTIIERGEPEVVLSGRIDVIDEDALQVGLIGSDRRFGTFDVGEAEFSIEDARIVVSRENVEWLIFETELGE